MKFRVLITVSLGWLAVFSSRVVLPPILPFIVEEFSISFSLAGLIATGIFLTYSLTQIPSGILTERYGEKLLLTISLALTLIFTLLISISPTYGILIVLSLFLGFSTGMYFPASVSLLARTFKERGRALGWNDLSLNAGGIIFPILAGYIAMNYGWRLSFLLPATVALISLILVIKLKGDKKPVTEMSLRKSITGNILMLMIAYILLNSYYWGVAVFLPSFAVSRGYSTINSSLVASIPFAGALIGNIFLGSAGDRYGKKRILTVLSFISGIAVFMMLRYELFIPAFIFGVTALPCFPMIFALVADVSGDSAGAVSGFINASGTLVGSMSPFILGHLIDVYGFDAYLITSMGILGGFLLLLQGVRERRYN